jgi:hypothetical protein
MRMNQKKQEGVTPVAKMVDRYHFKRQLFEAASLASARVTFAASAETGRLATIESTQAYKTGRNLC